VLSTTSDKIADVMNILQILKEASKTSEKEYSKIFIHSLASVIAEKNLDKEPGRSEILNKFH
jgi:hypothetical protein